MTRIVGIDSWSKFHQQILEEATSSMGQTPAFWGRYFHSQTKQTAPEYGAPEAALLSTRHIRVLPVARQTNRVGLSQADGEKDGVLNAKDIIAELGGEAYLRESCGRVRVFLDVEGDGLSRLSSTYYHGWCEALDTVAPGLFLPCVYGIPGDSRTWAALRRAVDEGCECGGVWLSHPYAAKTEPVQWDPRMLSPYKDIPGVPVLLWQYLFPLRTDPQRKQFDRNLVNPALADASEFLRTLPEPPP